MLTSDLQCLTESVPADVIDPIGSRERLHPTYSTPMSDLGSFTKGTAKGDELPVRRRRRARQNPAAPGHHHIYARRDDVRGVTSGRPAKSATGGTGQDTTRWYECTQLEVVLGHDGRLCTTPLSQRLCSTQWSRERNIAR
jgi:hypothetical protein